MFVINAILKAEIHPFAHKRDAQKPRKFNSCNLKKVSTEAKNHAEIAKMPPVAAKKSVCAVKKVDCQLSIVDYLLPLQPQM